MYKIYKIDNAKLEKITKITKTVNNIWINLESPTSQELKELEPYITIPEEVITDVKDVNEVPKLDKVDGWLYILLQTPIFHENKHSKESPIYTVSPLALLMNEAVIVTITWDKNDVMDYVEEKLKNISNNYILDTNKNTQFIIKIALFTSKIYLRYLKEISYHLRIPVETQHDEHVDKGIIQLLKIEESLVYFNASLRSNNIVVEKLAKRKQFTTLEEDEELINDALDENRQAIEVVGVYGRIVEDIRNALSSLISNNLTRTVNWLTRVTILLMIPAMIGSLYGMNVVLPFQQYPQAFWIVIALSVLVTALTMIWMNKKSRS